MCVLYDDYFKTLKTANCEILSLVEEVEKPKREQAKNEELVNSAPATLKWLNPLGAYYCFVACLLYQFLVGLQCR